jgi:hypothetical protein
MEATMHAMVNAVQSTARPFLARLGHDLARDWRRWSRAERIAVRCVAEIAAIGLFTTLLTAFVK